MSVCCDKEALGPVLLRLLNSVDAALVECDATPCRVFLSVEEHPPWDQCCYCADNSVGQLYVTAPKIVHLNNTDIGVMRCIGLMEATVKVGVLRCALTVDDAGNAPDPDLVSLQAIGVFRDRLAINQGIVCNFGPTYDSDLWTLGDWESLGPRGGCVGGEVHMTIRFHDPKCA